MHACTQLTRCCLHTYTGAPSSSTQSQQPQQQQQQRPATAAPRPAAPAHSSSASARPTTAPHSRPAAAPLPGWIDRCLCVCVCVRVCVYMRVCVCVSLNSSLPERNACWVCSLSSNAGYSTALHTSSAFTFHHTPVSHNKCTLILTHRTQKWWLTSSPPAEGTSQGQQQQPAAALGAQSEPIVLSSAKDVEAFLGCVCVFCLMLICMCVFA